MATIGCNPHLYCLQCKRERVYTFGIISAYPPEQLCLANYFDESYSSLAIKGRLFKRGLIDNKLVVAVLSGTGMTNAAMTTQMLIDYFDPRYVIFVGIAGAMHSSNKVGDVIICKRFVDIHHQKYLRGDNHIFYDQTDKDVDYPNKYFYISDQQVLSLTTSSVMHGFEVNSTGSSPASKYALVTKQFAVPMHVDTLTHHMHAYQAEVPQQFFFNADAHLLDIALQLQEQLNGEFKLKIGDTGLSSSTFVDNQHWKTDVIQQFAQAAVTVETIDMESAAFAHVSVSNAKPFLVIRSISDLAGHEDDTNLVFDNFQSAANNSILVLINMIYKI